MEKYTVKLIKFLSEQPLHFRYADAKSIMELLYYYYSQEHPVDSVMIRCQLEELNDHLQPLPFSAQDAIFSTAISLCVSHERQAFLDGMQVGMRLFSELNELPN